MGEFDLSYLCLFLLYSLVGFVLVPAVGPLTGPRGLAML